MMGADGIGRRVHQAPVTPRIAQPPRGADTRLNPRRVRVTEVPTTLIKTSLLTRLGVRDLMETAPGSVHPSVMVCGTVAFRDRRVPAQVAPQGRDPPNSPRVEASLVASAGLPTGRMGLRHRSV